MAITARMTKPERLVYINLDLSCVEITWIEVPFLLMCIGHKTVSKGNLLCRIIEIKVAFFSQARKNKGTGRSSKQHVIEPGSYNVNSPR